MAHLSFCLWAMRRLWRFCIKRSWRGLIHLMFFNTIPYLITSKKSVGSLSLQLQAVCRSYVSICTMAVKFYLTYRSRKRWTNINQGGGRILSPISIGSCHFWFYLEEVIKRLFFM